MSLTSISISLGLLLGSWGSGVWFSLFLFTRSYRQARNKLIIGLGYIVIGLSSLVPLFVLLRSLGRMGIRNRMPENDTALVAYTIGLASMAVLTFWTELKWRKSVGLWGKKFVPPGGKT